MYLLLERIISETCLLLALKRKKDREVDTIDDRLINI